MYFDFYTHSSEYSVFVILIALPEHSIRIAFGDNQGIYFDIIQFNYYLWTCIKTYTKNNMALLML